MTQSKRLSCVDVRVLGLAFSVLVLVTGAGCRHSDPGEDDECVSDDECSLGHCDFGVTCAAIGCPPPPPNVCTVCGDGSELRCKRSQPTCDDGLVPEIVNGCFGECVDRYSCAPRKPGTCIYEGTVYEVGDSFKSSDGCNDCSCSEGGIAACTLRLCIPPGSTGAQ